MKSLHNRRMRKNDWSLPTWERGLKYASLNRFNLREESLPTWERGLKSASPDPATSMGTVAPDMGAWIEINRLDVSAENS